MAIQGFIVSSCRKLRLIKLSECADWFKSLLYAQSDLDLMLIAGSIYFIQTAIDHKVADLFERNELIHLKDALK